LDAIKGDSMKICWIISEHSKKAVTEPNALKNVAPTWGSCSVHNIYEIDNIVCNDLKQAKQLINHNIQDTSNFYLSADSHKTLGNPPNVKVYQGEFKDTNINNKDDIIALNLVTQRYDIILLLGFKFAKSKSKDDINRHRQEAYLHNVRTIIKENADKQFVLVNYKGKLSKDFNALENLMRDSLSNVLELAQQI
jgi:hypothetical protein